VYRALAGSVPMGANLRALALALGVTENECRASIERGAEEAA
jgi:hypothetical protein